MENLDKTRIREGLYRKLGTRHKMERKKLTKGRNNKQQEFGVYKV